MTPQTVHAERPGALAAGTFLRRVARKPLGVISAAYLLLLALACALAPVVAPYPPLAQKLDHVLATPSSAHLLGTDELGRDVLSRLLYGGQDTLLGVLECVAVLLVVSLPVGLAAGYLGGWTDRVVSNVTDLMLSVPTIVVALAVLSVFGSSMTVAMITIGILGSAGVIRVIRSAVIAVREELYVAAARTSGVTDPRIVSRHVLPRIAGPVIVQTSLYAGIALALQSGLAFLGLGIQSPAPSWGGLVGEASDAINQDPWLLVPSGGIIALTILAFGLVGDAVRDAAVERWSGTAQTGRPAAPRTRPAEAAAPDSLDAAEPGALSVRGLTVEFDTPEGPVTVVDGVSFTLRPGEVLGLVGESGCGKSVTSLSLLGLLPDNGRISSGHVMSGGRDLAAMTERQLADVRGSEIAMVFQEPMSSLDPSFRVGSQLVETIRAHEKLSRREARERVLTLLEQVRLPDPADVYRRYPHELSGGMAQRVCIAQALATGPRILVADEPTTALDVTVQAEILALLRTLQAETGMSVILVTHDWGVVADLCDRAVVMYAGQIVEEAPIHSLFHHPHHPYTLGLQECNPERWSGTGELPVIPGMVPPPNRRPKACRFEPRCSLAGPECTREPIPLLSTAPDDDGLHQVRCVNWQKVQPARTP
ncbi:dipeptide/oligopeptide/nickel ABC transporter permease/ATP-binding protein [Streptomyces sp. NBC_00038]|uniref:dipeptide/oligopeptide/nickel ABC transporter permease/ATP-binding protein n=1 Tax=Streptomyces sp. NBC_00038 TaxID=2903615 RepID=UPI00224FE60D|nr:dipeptide/oligopeptide/nickel ABC transporter permease/ATP-binding protein [Streptomyces sp. NBC_00038]MCX5555277.1 dipeptide/oligopeptide/nickel ABC transporter permease/ATP-binding protein [Streptomyces sp. NBC_00038]